LKFTSGLVCSLPDGLIHLETIIIKEKQHQSNLLLLVQLQASSRMQVTALGRPPDIQNK